MKKAFWIVNKLDSNTAEIYLYGYIGYYDGVTAQAFVKELKELEKEYKNINIRVNSGGGMVYDGFAIFNAIRNSKATIDGYIDGMAASMGGVIVMACRKVYMSRVAQFMSHRVQGGVFGNAEEMERTAKTLVQLEDSISKIFAERTSKTIEECRDEYLNKGDRWLSAQECLDEGLVDAIYDAEEMTAPANITDAEQLWQAYDSQLQQVLNQVINKNQNPDMKRISLPISAELMTQLGIAQNATDDAMVAAVNAELARIPTLQNSVAKLTQQTTDLQGKLDALNAAGKEQKVQGLLDKAVTDKKLTAEARATFEKTFKDNPDGLEAVLNSLKPFTSVVEEINRNKGEQPKNSAELAQKFDEMDEKGTLQAHAKANWEDFTAMYQAKYGNEPKKENWQ